MSDKKLRDFTPAFKKIFTLTENIRRLRRSFPFSKNDDRAKRDREFIRKWREIKKNSE